jgi:DNA-binding LacI/PurR family transcriptional regulator
MNVTVHQVAAAAAVSVSSASRALRGLPGVGASTRARIITVAERLGWRPDPMLSALSRYRRRERAPQAVCIGHLLPQERGPHQEVTRVAVAERATALGYLVQELSIADPHLERCLALRHIAGVVIQDETFPLPTCLPPGLAYVQLMGVAMGARWPVVAPNHFQDIDTALDHLARLGYRRPALMLPAWFAASCGRDSLGAWRAFAPTGAVREPFLRIPGEDAAFLAWWRRELPDCLLYQGRGWPIAVLAQAGVEVPRDAGFVSLDLDTPSCGQSGIWSDRPRLAHLAVDLLHARLGTGELGDLDRAPCLAVGGRWIDGTTLRPQG